MGCHSETNEVKLKNPEKLNYLYWILRFAQNDWLDVNKSHSASLLMEDGNLRIPRYLVMNNHNQLALKSSTSLGFREFDEGDNLVE